MQDDDFISDEELEWRADQRVESLLNGPSYRRASCDDFSRKLQGIDAKRCWLKFTENGETVPPNVIAALFKAIKNEVESHEKRLLKQAEKKNTKKIKAEMQKAEQLVRRIELFKLLHIAKTNLDGFWKLLHNNDSSIFKDIDTGNKEILDTLRKWLPERREFKKKEVYAIFDELSQGKDKPPIDPYFLDDGFVQAFRNWRQGKK